MKRFIVVAIAVFSLLAGPPARADPPDKWALWQNGTHLRGVNIYQRRSYLVADGPDLAAIGPLIPPFTQADFDELRALGANYVNISHPGLYTDDVTPYQLDLAVQNNLDQLLDQIAQANMVAVISFRTGPGRNEFIFLEEEDPNWVGFSLDNELVWTSQAAQDAWVTMWRYTAERYKDNPVVVGYDLMVEPNSNRLLDIWDPAEFYNSAHAGSLYDWNQFYPRLSTAIREVDPNTPILIGAMSYSAISWLPYLQPTGDPRTVYTVHQYEPFVYTHQNFPGLAYPGPFDVYGVTETVNQAWLDNMLTVIDTYKNTHQVPVAVNEYGLKRWQPGGASFMADQMALFEQRGLNHAWWAWQTSDERFAEVVHDFNLLLGPDPDNRQKVTTSALLEVIRQNWAQLETSPGEQRAFLPLILQEKGP